MTSVDKLVDALTFAVERVLALALILGISLNFINVVGRYLAGYTMNGVDEVEIYILIWIAFLGAAIVTWRGEHLRMDVLLSACPVWVQKAEAVIETLVMFVVTGFRRVAIFSLCRTHPFPWCAERHRPHPDLDPA